MNKTIAIDIDEVLSALHEPFLNHYNQTYGTRFVYPDPAGRYYLTQFTGESHEDSELKIRHFVEHPSFDDVIVPLPGAVETIRHLKAKGYTLIIVTARQPFYKVATKRFLDQHFPALFSAVRYIPHSPGAALTPMAAKLRICKRAGVSYLIDDNADTAVAAVDKGMQAVLFGDYHWNKTKCLPAGVKRCKDWAAVREYFDGRDG